MDPLQWMGAVRMRVQAAYKNITIIHQTTPVHQYQQPYQPAAQDWLPTEAKQGWAWSVPGWETSWKTRLLLEEVLVRQQGGYPVVYVGPNALYSDGDTILSTSTVYRMRH